MNSMDFNVGYISDPSLPYTSSLPYTPSLLYSPSSPTMAVSSKKLPFKVGQELMYEGQIAYFVGEDKYPPGSYISERIFIIEKENGWVRNGRISSTYKPYKFDTFWAIFERDLHLLKPAEPKIEKFDLKELDRLIIAAEIRVEIESVLKQHKNSKKLFEEWGLGKTIEYGKGMTFLFYGGPGTGKTWGAHCIAKTVGKELLVIGAAEIQSSEPGGANRNIQNAFKSAKELSKVLFIDECDSLITSRDDVGMIIGGEINTLLTEIEQFEGICILATNRIDTLDEALERRISLIVEFLEPNFEQREQIWLNMLPIKMPLGNDINLSILAAHKLTGGQIKNVLLQAARLAAAEDAQHVEKAHFDRAIERVQKSKSLMGTRSRYNQKIDYRRG